MDAADEGLLRALAPQVLAAVARRHGRFDLAEDAVQEALVAAARQWPVEGRPDHPHGWLVAVASRRLIDAVRADTARTRREEAVRALEPPPDPDGPAEAGGGDDTLTLLFLCCHPALSPPSQLALTLRAVGGLTTAEVAAAFLVPERTMAQRISRAKATIADAGGRFAPPAPEERADRLRVVLHVLYLVFNEGYSASSGERLQRRELAREAIRLTRTTRALLPDDGEVAGLLALMLLTDARSAARERPDGTLVPLAEQDRRRWDRALVDEGTALIRTTLASRTPLGPYQLQAAIAAVHAEADDPGDTDWRQVRALYDVLAALAPSPVVTLNRAVAVAMADGPRAGLALLGTLDAGADASTHRVAAVRAHLHELAGEDGLARAASR